jgi:hypothetical protein
MRKMTLILKPFQNQGKRDRKLVQEIILHVEHNETGPNEMHYTQRESWSEKKLVVSHFLAHVIFPLHGF